MKEEIKKEQQNGRDLKAKDKKFGRGKSPNNRRDRSRSPVERRKDTSSKAQRRVYVANVAFDTHWSDLKDLFRDKVGNVTYCQLFEDEEGRSRGCGLVEFQDANSAKKAIDDLHRFNYKGRELVVKEDIDCERDRYGRLIPNKKEKERESQRDVDRRDRLIYDSRQGFSAYNTYGLSPQFLESLGISGPLNNRIFVANLDYKVGEKKLEEIFRLAGKVLRVRLYTDQQGTSKGHGTVEFEHPVEAVQAISMFHDQNLYARPMSIRMDKYETEEMPEVLPSKLPSGLEGIGKGLGVGGQPLNISKSLLNASLAQQPVVTQQTAPQVAAIPAQSLAAPTQSQVSSYNISGLTSALGQQSVGLNPSMPSAQVNQAINSGLNSLGLGNLSSSSLTASLSNQNLNQLANTAQNVLAAAASLGGTSLNPALGLTSTQAQNNLFSSYERDFGADKFRNGANNQPSNNAGQGVDTILVRNLPPSFSWQNLRDRFNEIGEVRFAELKNRGMAVVRFQNIRDAQRAVDLMNGIRIDNKPIEVGLYY